ncbi:MAG: alpha/beta hydrolase [Phycisphaerales bacterium]|nr:alpha/beta hydrolase [Phycisphaerales bacterium]
MVKQGWIAQAFVLAFALPTFAATAPQAVIPVWPKLNVPAAQRVVHYHQNKYIGQIALHPILWPTLSLFPAPRRLANGCAVVICPGGGYSVEAMSLEGYRVARRLNEAGISCFVLEYRLPLGKLPPSGIPWCLQDVRRAVQIVRSHAAAWNINPHDVGVMGFSAGGSVAVLSGVHWLPGNPDAKDPLNRLSTRPDFLVLGYPVISMLPAITHMGSHNNLLGQHPPLDVEQYFSGELNVTALTPPSFIFYAHNDTTVNHQNEKQFYAALVRNRIPAKLVKFKLGNHGFGLGQKGTDSTRWPAMCLRWLKARGFLPAKAPSAAARGTKP